VLGGVHNSPRRATGAESSINGRAINDANATAAGEAGLTGNSPMTVTIAGRTYNNTYKVQVAKTLIKRGLLKLVA
ncbi:MAG: hypothetical protein FWF18_06005, partial [Dehalococcoidia bacterium]|nr:hypothetical protein [Dehalococcoidia bacterium]